MNTKRAMAQLLKHLQNAGVTHITAVEIPKPAPPTLSKRMPPAGRPGQQSVDRSGSVAASSPADPVSASGKAASGSPVARSYRTLIPPADLDASSIKKPEPSSLTLQLLEEQFETAEARSDALSRLAELVSRCTRCSELSATRRQTVFGTGNSQARIMLIGEAPGADEDARGEPFVGKAGQLLDKIIESSQLRREDLYICNILRCRPPGNRNPLPQEACNCREFLDAQIHIVKPEYIICLGTVAAQNLLGSSQPVSKLRGQFLEYNGAKVMCTYHPSYLLRYPAAKAQVWEDMKFFMKDLGVILK